jgi:putative thiamine transport system permease protein
LNAFLFLRGLKRIPYFQIGFILTLGICFLPLLPGLTGLLLSALGFIPALNQYHFSLLGFYQLLSWPGITQSILSTLLVTLASTLLTTLLAFSIVQSCWHSRWWKKIENLLAPILALPHVAFAVGFAFLFSTSGFLARIAQLLNESTTFSDWDIIHNQYGLGLIFALTIKEIPFIIFMSIPIFKQLNVDKTVQIGQSLGYSRDQVWQKIIFPQWLPKIRFSLFAIMAYSLSVVDVSLVIGPTNPPTLPVLLWSWLNDANLFTLPKASAGAFLLLLSCIVLVYLIRFLEWLIAKRCQGWQVNGRFALPTMGKSVILITYAISFATLLILFTWSFVQRWSYPDIIPTQWSGRFWLQEWDYLWTITKNSALLAIASATIALICVLILHENNAQSKTSNNTKTSKVSLRFPLPALLIFIPILAPQISLLFGMQVATLYIANQHYYLWVIWSHIFFAFPYLYLALDGPWRSYDQRLDRIGLSLGMSPFTVCWKIKMPILLPAILFAWAIAISVSLAQYLPTMMLGAGRISTLTTEAVALASGQDRRISAIYALMQSLLPALFFILAIIIGRKTGKLDNRTRSCDRNDIITQ